MLSLKDDNKKMAAMTNQDMYEKTRKLEAPNYLHLKILDSLPEALIAIDEDMKVVLWNRASLKFFNISVDDALGENVLQLIDGFENETVRSNIEKTFMTQQRQQFDLSVNPASDNEKLYRVSSFLIQGNIPALVLLRIKDLTCLKEKERQKRFDNRISFLGKYSAKLAHNINNPLGTILNTIDFLDMDLSDNLDVNNLQQNLGVIRQQVYRIADFTKDLLALTPTPKESFSLLDINDVLERTFALLDVHYDKQKIKFNFNYSKNLPKIFGNDDRLELALNNILLNAIEAIEDKGSISIITAPDGHAGENVLVMIKDNGCGIATSMLRKVLHPYVSTKKKKGAGLGLTIAYSIFIDHGATLKIKSELNRGTFISIVLPGVNSKVNT